MTKIILASGSPRRRELLDQIGLKYKVEVSNTDESQLQADQIPIHLYVQELAYLKAAAVAKAHRKDTDTLIIGADTVVYHNSEILGKPKDKIEAFKMLMSLSGKTHRVYTGFCIMDPGTAEAVCDREITQVTFKKLTKEQVVRYIQTGEPFDKAGGYGIQGLGSVLVDHIEGDYANVVGLPLSKLCEKLEQQFHIQVF